MFKKQKIAPKVTWKTIAGGVCAGKFMTWAVCAFLGLFAISLHL